MNSHSSTLVWPSARLYYRFAAILTFLLFYSAHAQTVHAQTDENGQLGPNGKLVAEAVNQARVDAGLPPLAPNPLLSLAAQAHVNDMIANYRYSHQGSDGSFAAQRVERTGYPGTPWVSENWVSAKDPSSAMRWWMGDYIHRVNILGHHWIEVGVGVGRRPGSDEMIFVTVFSAGADAQGAVVASVPSTNPAPPKVVQEVPPGGLDYTVRAGDTLLGIALQYDLDWQTLANANGLSEHSLIQIGQTIWIPDQNQLASSANANTLLQGSGTGPVEYSRAYTVQPGDTLYTIASRNGLTWQQLSAGNGLNEQSMLQIGQVIYLPATTTKDVSMALAAPPPSASTAASTSSSTPSSTTAQPTISYTVQPGDTIITIAFRHGLDWQELTAVNDFTDDTHLQPGQLIRLPLKGTGTPN